MPSSELEISGCGCIDPAVFGHLCEKPPAPPPEAACHCAERHWPELRWRARDDGLEEAVSFRPGYICQLTAGNPQSHGRHGMELLWVLRGPAGAATFLLFTDWLPVKQPASATWSQVAHLFPMGADLSIHSPVPLYGPDHYAMPGGCQLIGGTCFTDGSSLQAQELTEQFRLLGDEVIWAALAAAYHTQLNQRQH